MELNEEAVKKSLDWLDNLVGYSKDSDIAMFTYQLLGILYDTCTELTRNLHTVQADTVRKMQELLDNRIKDKFSYHGWYLKETVIPEIAKEIIEQK